MVKGIHVPVDPSEPLEVCDFANLAAYRAAVEGWIEPVDVPDLGITIYVNEEGLLRHLPFNSRAVDASPSLRSKRDLVESFVDSVSLDGAVDEQWQAFVAVKREAELEAIIAAQKLKPEPTRAFIDAAFRDGHLRTTGTEITRILPPVCRFRREAGRGDLKRSTLEALTVFFDRFFGPS